MNGSTASVSGSSGPASVPGAAGRLLLVSPNWIGDVLMAMPAVQAWRAEHPHHHLAVLCRPGVADLWRMHAAPDGVLTYDKGRAATRELLRQLRGLRFDRCVIFPNSFRSAMLPWAGRIPRRTGFRGHWRRCLLSTVVRPALSAERPHQAWEGFDLLGTAGGDRLEPPRLTVPDRANARAEAWLPEAGGGPWVALMPGAARGPAKRWPVASFAEVAARLVCEAGCRIAICGGPGDRAAGAAVAEAAGPGAVNLCGETDVPTWAAVLRRCAAAVCNDSGGMHLAAAAGVPVVALYGLTDPSRTGPIGDAVTLLRGSEGGGRDIPRASAEAEKALASIPPQAVYEAVLSWIHPPPAGPP